MAKEKGALSNASTTVYDVPPAYDASSSKAPASEPVESQSTPRPNLIETYTSRFSFLQSKSTKTTIQSQKQILRDVVMNPSEVTAQVLGQVLETCKRQRIDVRQVFSLINNHRILFWTVAKADEMPGAFEILWSNRNQPFVSIPDEALVEAESACMIHDDIERFRMLRLEKVERLGLSNEGSAKDTCKIWPSTEANRLIVDIDITSFRLRWCSSAKISFSFPARHKLWSVVLLTGRADPALNIPPNQRTVSVNQYTSEHGMMSDIRWRAQIALRTMNSSAKSVELKDTGHSKDGVFRYGLWDKLGTSWRDLDIGSDEYMTNGTLGLRIMIDWPN